MFYTHGEKYSGSFWFQDTQETRKRANNLARNFKDRKSRFEAVNMIQQLEAVAM